MATGEVFKLGATTPPSAFAHADAYAQASAQANWSSRRGIDLTAGFDLQGKVDAQAGGSGVSASFAAGVDVSGALAVQAALPIDLFSAEGAGLVARLQAKLALTAFVTAVISLDRGVLEQAIQAEFGGPMSSLLDIVLDELEIGAGFWGRASLAIEAMGEAVLAGSLLPSSDNGAGLTFSVCYETAFLYGAGIHFLTNLGFAHPQRLFTRLAGEISDQLLALVTPTDPDDATAVAVGLGAIHTLLPVAVRGLLQLGMSLVGDPAAATQTATSSLASSVVSQGQQAVLQGVSDLAMGLLGDTLTDARLVAALSRVSAEQLTSFNGQVTALQNSCEALVGTSISDIDQWLAGLLACLGALDDLLNSLAASGVAAAVIADGQSWTAMLWAAGTLLQRIIGWADDASSGSPFGSDAVTPDPPASVAATVKPSGGPLAYGDVVAYLLASKVVTDGLETALRSAIPEAGAIFDWLNTVLQGTQGQLIQTLFAELAAPSDQQAAALVGQLTAAAADALTNHILPELLDPLAAAETDSAVAALVEDVVKPGLAALPQVILPGLAGLSDPDAATRIREVVSALLLHTVEHFVSTTLKALVDHALTTAQAALNAAAADVTAGGAVERAVKDIDALAAVLLTTYPEIALLIPTPGDVSNVLTLAGTVAADLQQLADDLFALIDELMQFGLGADSTRQASLQALANSDLPVDQQGLSNALGKVGDGALKAVEDVLSDLPTLIADHAANEVTAIVAAVEQVAGQVVTALNNAISALEQAGQTAANYLNNVLLPELRKLLGDLGATIAQFGAQIQGLAAQAVEQVRQAGLNVIEGLMGGPPVSWAQHAIVDLYNALFDAITDITSFLTGILAAGATAVGDLLMAIANGGHGTHADTDAALRQGLLAASSADLNFELKVSVAGVTLLDLGTITISAGTIGGILHDQVSGDTSSQSLLSTGAEQAATAAQTNAQVAAAQTQQAANTSQTTALQAQVNSFTLPATPAVQVVTPSPGATVPFGARVLIRVSGANVGFVATTLGAAPRVVITVNGVRWTYQPADWVTDALDPATMILQADLVAFPLTGAIGAAGPGGTAPLAAQSVTTTPAVSAMFDARTATLVLQPTTPPPPRRRGCLVPAWRARPRRLPPQPLPMTGQPWTRRALLRQALADPTGTLTVGLAGAGRFTATNNGTGQRTPVPTPQPWTLNPPSPDPAISRSVPVMVGKLGLNTISVAVADGAGHTATAATTVVIEPGPLYAISAKHSGSCLTVTGGETADSAGAAAQQFAWAGGRNQMWQLVTGAPAPPDGAVDLTAAHSGLTLGLSTAVPESAYDAWYGCAKCGVLFAADAPPSQSACAGGGSHDADTSPDFFLGNYIMVAGWSQCRKCAGLFTDVSGRPSVCPAGGTHVGEFAAETSWTLPLNVTVGADMPAWQECGKCGALVAADGTGTCPAGGGHSPSGSPTVIPSLDMDGTPLAQGNPGGPWQVLPGTDPRYRQLQRQRSDGSTRVAEVAGASLADGATVDQATSTGADSQQWRLTPVPAIDPAAYYTVTNRNSGLVLEVQGGPTAVADRTAIDQAAASGQANQRWRFLPNSDGSYAIVAEHSGSCLSLPSEQIRYDAGPVIQSRPSPIMTPGIGVVPPQSWQLIPASPGYYRIQSAGTGLVLDVQAGSTAAGAVVTQGTWRGAASQEWAPSMVTDLDTGAWYTITARHSGLAVGVAGGPAATQPGTAVEQEVPANMMSQRWRLLPGSAAGCYVLLAQHTTLAPGSGGCLDLAGGATASGTPVVLNTRDGAASQNWQLITVEPGVYKIQNLAAGLVLQAGDEPGALAPGVAAQAAAWTGADNQKWWLTG